MSINSDDLLMQRSGPLQKLLVAEPGRILSLSRQNGN
jgi:hypothetical protein